MGNQTYSKKFFRKFATLLLGAVFLTQVNSCSDSNGNPDPVATAVLFSFLFDNPTFFAFKDGDGAWTQQTVSGGNLSMDVTDTAGRYSFVAYGNFRGMMKGYYMDSTLDDISDYSLKFDDTSATTTYNLTGNVSNFDFGNFYVGLNFRNFANETFLLNGFNNAFSPSFVQDADEPSTGDTLIVLNAFGSGHTKFGSKNYLDGLSIDYTADPADVNGSSTIDHSAIRLDGGYMGLGVKVIADNLKALLYKDEGISGSSSGSVDTFSYSTFSLGAGKTFNLSAKWQFPGTGSVLSESLKYIELYNDIPPPSVTFDQSPARAPAITVGNDTDFTIRVDLPGIYESGVPGVMNVMRCVTTSAGSSPVVEWDIKQSNGRYQAAGSQSFGFPAELLALPNFPAGMQPTDAGVSKVNEFSTNQSVQSESDFINSEQAASAADDGRTRIFYSAKF